MATHNIDRCSHSFEVPGVFQFFASRPFPLLLRYILDDFQVMVEGSLQFLDWEEDRS